MTMTVFDIVVLIAAACGLAMVVGGIWLLARGAITLAATPKTDALTLEWKKQFRINTQVPGLAFFLVGLIRMRGKPRPSDLVAKQPLGEAVELGRGRIARTPPASLRCPIPASVAARCTAEQC